MRVVLIGIAALAWMVLAADPLTSSSECFDNQYECQDDGRCIPDSWVCDGYPDCPYYGDDEDDCFNTTTTDPISSSRACIDMDYHCQYDGSCIPARWVCDGYQDCPVYGDDEDDCIITVCPDDHYQCQFDGSCIPDRWVCDGFPQCNVYSDDEDDCFSTTATGCPDHYYQCQFDGSCIPDRWVCDGDTDCPYYGDDEDDCFSTTATGCSDIQYECQYDGSCIPDFWVCDGYQDCPYYGDDEDDCFSHDYSTTSTTTTTGAYTSLPIECKSPFDYIHDRCVFVDPFTSNSWEEARYFCQKFDSDLVVLDDFNFYGKLLQYMNNAGIEEHDYWVGARDQQEGVWRWVDDTPVHVGAPLWALYGCTNDYSLEPRASEAEHQDCGYLDTSRGHYMSDASCDEKYAAICQGQRSSTAEQEKEAQEPVA